MELIVKVELIATALTLCLASGAVIAQQSIVDALDLIEIQQFQNEHGGLTKKFHIACRSSRSQTHGISGSTP